LPRGKLVLSNRPTLAVNSTRERKRAFNPFWPKAARFRGEGEVSQSVHGNGLIAAEPARAILNKLGVGNEHVLSQKLQPASLGRVRILFF
jgi:hypothetical protein